jgi:hypothetical protein
MIWTGSARLWESTGSTPWSGEPVQAYVYELALTLPQPYALGLDDPLRRLTLESDRSIRPH